MTIQELEKLLIRFDAALTVATLPTRHITFEVRLMSINPQPLGWRKSVRVEGDSLENTLSRAFKEFGEGVVSWIDAEHLPLR